MNNDGQGMEIKVVTSRRALIDVVMGLADHREALAVLGGHAVIEVAQGLPSALPDDTTRDGVLGVFPNSLLMIRS